MSPLRQSLIDLITDPDHAYNLPPAELRERQMAAVAELVRERVGQIPLLARRAEEVGLRDVQRLDDLVPLLFAHTVYKSYPPAFVDQGRWDKLLRWLQALSVSDVSNVDVRGVNDVDDWIERLWAAGHRVLATSGSSGKCSFLNHTTGDSELKQRHFKYTVGWPYLRANADRTVFFLGPMKGANSAVEAANFNAINFGRPGHVHALTDKPLRIADVSRLAALNRKMADGTALPHEISDLQRQAAAAVAGNRDALLKLADQILDLRHEPIIVSGLWAQHMAIIEHARRRGILDGDFHPQSMVAAGGGVKNVKLPDDYREQVDRFYGKVIRPAAYGMTEIASLMPRCEAGRYHCPPSLIWLILDQTGERLLTEADAVNGIVVGRFGFVDLIYEGRWGGVITGDKVTVDLKSPCVCGRYGPTLQDNITRWAQPGEDDHIGCAGTIDSYVRGVVEA